ncbi:class I SAM-dependent methyltransferase [Candidatus Bathyarchaeota archaeon]|nr:MAG: class I SAM-dependent methyltransferase [Candidatus Bathyarchaeota archaeon]
MRTLNVGCGQDDWGEVRVDVDYETQTHVESKLNVREDAHHLPFRDSAFSFGRCWHVLEHLDNPKEALLELRRTCERFDVRFPVDEGYYMQMIIGFLNLDLQTFLGAYRTLRGRFHLWRISPSFIERSLIGQTKYSFSAATVSDRFIGYPSPRILLSGRKSRLFKRFFRIPIGKYYYEWKVEDQAGQVDTQ